MFKNHIKTAWRNLTKNKQQTIINLLGLTVGTISCLILFGLVSYVAEQKKKEIGIWKVLGARLFNLKDPAAKHKAIYKPNSSNHV